MEEQQEGQESPQQKQDKILRAFTETVAKAEAILGGKLPTNNRRRIKKDALETVVGELFKEENEALQQEVKVELKAMLVDYVEFHREKAKREEELKQVTSNKMKEFVEKGKKLFAKIEDLPALEKSYKEALGTLTGSIATPPASPGQS